MLKNSLQKPYSSIVIIIALLGLIGYIPGIDILENISAGHIPMAPSTAICFLLVGFISLQLGKLNQEKLSLRLHKQLIVTLLVSLFGILEVVGFILGMDLTFENRLVPDFGDLQGIPIARMSPATGFAFFISGISLTFYIFRLYYSANNKLLGNIGSILAIFLLLMSSTFTLAYLYGSPLLYGLGNTIPMALTTALGFLFLSISIVTIDNNVFIFKLLTEDSARSHILRYLLPFSIATIIISILGISFGQMMDINPAFTSAFVSILMTIIAIIISLVIARTIGNKIDLAKVAEIQAKQSLQKSEESIRKSQNQLLNVITGAKLGYWDWNYKTGEQIVNVEWLLMLGLSPQDTTNHVRDWEGRLHPNDKELIKRTVQIHIQSGKNFIAEFRMKHSDGRWIWIQGSGGVVEYDENTHEPLRLCGTHQDITERKKIEEATLLSARVFKDTHEGIIITDAKMNIVDVNPAFCEITGYSREEVLGQNPRILSSGRQDPTFYQDMWQTINENGHWQGEVWNRKKSGEVYAELLIISVLKDELDKVTNYIGVFTDITSSKQQQEQLSLMAHYDVLTSLPNRTLFVDRFTQAIAHSKRTKHQLAICFLDLDNFKPVNDNFGHEIGDKLLIEVANRITDTIREEDTVSRQGGDEFALLLNDIESFSQCEQTLQRIHYTLGQPYIIDDVSHKITVSSGVTLYPDDHGDIDTLLRHADQAMYQAKLEGKHRYHLFNPEHDQRTIQKHHRLEEIQRALVNNEFQLYYQPKVNMLSGNVFGAEALIRWIHPERGLIPPLDFLPVIEGTELEIKVGNWVISQAVQQLETWCKQDINIEVSINIASHHLLSETFFTELDTTFSKHPAVNSSYLQLEILESSALGDLSAISSIIDTCQRGLGITVALDDFGTGYSSLTHLRSLPVDTIKIDQSFVRDMLDDPSDYAIIEGVIGLAESFSRQVIAEGVETTNHGLMLLAIGCKAAQGYGIARPMPADDFPQWLRNYIPNQEWQQYSRQYRTEKENEVILFRLMANHWKDLLINTIQSSSEKMEHWPILESKDCNCGAWIKRAKQKRLFEAEFLNQLSDAHEASHLIAQGQYMQYCDGDIDAALKGLPDIHAAFDNMNHALALCE